MERKPTRSALIDFVTMPLSLRRWTRTLPDTTTEEHLEKGYILILPGIEGQSHLNMGIVRGLVDAGEESAIEIFDWTTGYWPLLPYHLRSLKRNRRQARLIAGKIVDYQDRYPGRPVRLLGHSGGGAMVLLALETLPSERTVTCALLLATAISPRYDLTTALKRSENGIYNYSSPFDIVFLGAGTTLLGTVDGRHTFSAGAIGFKLPPDLSPAGKALYASRLHEQRYTAVMARSWHLGGHTGWTNRRFVAQWLAPRISLHPSYVNDEKHRKTQS